MLTCLASKTFSQTEDATIYDQYQDSIGKELEARVGLTEHMLEKLNRWKIAGYIQPQFVLGDTSKQLLSTHGTLPDHSNNQFQLRRSRIVASYEYNNLEGINLTQISIQFNSNVTGFTLMEAWGKVTDPWNHWFGIRAGLFKWPMGYEIIYSSSNREVPERSRMMTALFPSERDMGFSFLIGAPKTSPWNWVRLEAGLFNGTGVGAAEFDKKKDFCTQLVFNKSNINETFKFSGGLSYYNGGFKYGNPYEFELSKNNGKAIWALKDSTLPGEVHYAKREYFGADAQCSISTPIGITTVRAEVITGLNAGTNTSSTLVNALPTGNIYQRKFIGGNFYLIQNLFNSKHTVCVRYDWYDPNKEVSGLEIADTKNTGLSLQDIMFRTFTLSYIFNFDHTWKLMISKEFITNEKTSLPKYTSDAKDNLFTVRMQYRFNNI